MPDRSPYDSDPAALAWARAKVQHHIGRLTKFEQQADAKGDTDKARGLAIARRSTEQLLIGGEGCVIAAFDARLPEWTARIDTAIPPRSTARCAVTTPCAASAPAPTAADPATTRTTRTETER